MHANGIAAVLPGAADSGLRAVKASSLDPAANIAQVKVEAGLSQLSVEELVRHLVGNGNGNGNGGRNGNGGGSAVGSIAGS